MSEQEIITRLRALSEISKDKLGDEQHRPWRVACKEGAELLERLIGTRSEIAQPSAAPSAIERKFEERPVAWLIERADGSKEIVPTPLTDDTPMDEGDTATPLHAAVWTQDEIDQAEARAKERWEWFSRADSATTTK